MDRLVRVLDGSASASRGVVVLGGNDGAGKTALVACACRQGSLTDGRDDEGNVSTSSSSGIRRPVPTLGMVEREVVMPGGRIPMWGSPSGVGSVLRVRDVGAGAVRGGDVFRAAAQMEDTAAMVFVVAASDARAYSALWELYDMARRIPSHAPVCVAVVQDDDDPPLWPALCKVAAKEALPPGGTPSWSPERLWLDLVGEEVPDSSLEEGYVDAEWHPLYEADRVRFRAGVPAYAKSPSDAPEEGRAAVVSRPWSYTASHGTQVSERPQASPPLATLHRGPWGVVPVDLRVPDSALAPFLWIADRLTNNG